MTMSSSDHYQSSSDLTSTGYETAQSYTSSQEDLSSIEHQQQQNENTGDVTLNTIGNNSTNANDNASHVSVETLQQKSDSNNNNNNNNNNNTHSDHSDHEHSDSDHHHYEPVVLTKSATSSNNSAAQAPEELTTLNASPKNIKSSTPKSKLSSSKSPIKTLNPDDHIPIDFASSNMQESEDFHLALNRTLSRKSLTRTLSQKSIKLHSNHSFKHEKDDNDDDTNELDDEDEGIDASTLDWDNPEDKDNPKNWSSAKKWFVTMTTACICLSVTFGSSLYVCGVPDLMLKMGISQELGLSGLTFYLIGLAFGPAISAPLSELFGRRVVYCSSLPISMLFTMGVGLSDKIRDILVLRFFSGFFASPAMAVAGGTISDIWEFEMMGLAMAGFCLAPFMGPVLGPVIGGFVAEKKGWKWTMWVNLFMAGLVLVPTAFCPETYKPIILKKRAKHRGIKLAKPHASVWEFLKFVCTVTLMIPMKMLIVEPIVMVFSIYIAFIFAVLFGFFEAYPLIFRGVYKMTLGKSGLTFLGIFLGFLLGTALYIYLDRCVYFKKNPDGTRGQHDENGKLQVGAPEEKLFICKIGAVVLPPSLFWIGWTSREDVHWISAVIAGVPFGFGLILIFFCTMIYFSMTFPPLSLASALAANNFFRYILASVFPLFVIQMYKKLGIDWASSLFGFIALALLPVPWVFEKWGPGLRQRSVYGYAAMMKKAALENEALQKLQQKTENQTDELDSSDDMMESRNC